MYELKIYRGVLCHGNEEWREIWRGIDLPVQNLYEEFDEFWPEHSKISKICALMGFFWIKYIMVELKKVQGSFAWWHWKLMQHLKEHWLPCFQKWHEEFSKLSPEHVWKSKNWNFDGILLSKVENLWAQSLHGKCLSWQWWMIHNLKRNWFVSSKLTQEIWQILTWALKNPKNLHFNWLLLMKVKYSGGMFDGTEVDGKFEGNWLVLSKNFRLMVEK